MIVPFAFALTVLVEGETCPAPADVERRVRAILHLSDEQQLSEGFVVQRREAGLFVELRSADSTPIGERLLPNEGSCDELAQAAAVVLGAWLTDVHPDFAPRLPEPEPAVVPAPPPRSPPVAPPPPPATVRTAPPAKAPLALPAYRLTTELRPHLEAGVGLGSSGGSWAFAGSMGAALVIPRSGLGARATVLLDAARREPLGGGSVVWRRWPVSLGPVLRLSRSLFDFDITLAPGLVWLRASGAQLEPSRTQNGLTWAGVTEVRVATRGRYGWFAGVHGQTYLADSSAYAGEAEFLLPRFVVTLLVGGRLSP